MINEKYEKQRFKIIADSIIGKTVLDIGHSQKPNIYLSNFESTGFDIKKTDKKSEIYKEELQGDIQDISKIINKKFDTIICGELIEHIEKPYDFLRNLHSILKNDGRLILSTPNPLGFPMIFYETFHKKNRFYSSDHKYCFLPRWTERLLNNTGFKLIKIKPVGLWCLKFYIPSPISLSYQLVYIAEKK